MNNHTNLNNEIYKSKNKFPIGAWIAWGIVLAIIIFMVVSASKRDAQTFNSYNPQDVAKVVCDSGICM